MKILKKPFVVRMQYPLNHNQRSFLIIRTQFILLLRPQRHMRVWLGVFGESNLGVGDGFDSFLALQEVLLVVVGEVRLVGFLLHRQLPYEILQPHQNSNTPTPYLPYNKPHLSRHLQLGGYFLTQVTPYQPTNLPIYSPPASQPIINNVSQLYVSMIAMLRQADRPATLTLIGGCLIKFATGLSVTWGTSNIYFYSALKHQGETIDPNTNSLLLILGLLPMCFAVLASNPLARLLGYKTSLKLCALLFTLSPLMINLTFTKWTFTLFWLVLPLSCFCLGAMPVINCLWTQFPKHLSKISGLAVLMFSVGMITWNLVFLQLVNPDNLPATVDENGIPIFPREVSDRVFSASNRVYLVAGGINLLGSFLVTRKHDAPMPEPSSTVLVQVDPISEAQRAVSSISQHNPSPLVTSLKDPRFLLIFFICGLLPVYLIYLVLNVKLLYMPIINDDHFLSYCSALVTISAVVGAPLWGSLCDRQGFKPTLMLLILVDCLVKIAGVFCEERWSIAALFFLLGVNDKGMLTIVGPGLIGMFGIDMATEIIPYKGLAVFLAYVITPSLQMGLSGVITHQQLLGVYTLLSFVSLLLGFYLNYYVPYRVIDPAEQLEKELLPVKVKGKDEKDTY